MTGLYLGEAVSAILVFLGLMHVYWVIGGRIGRSAAIPQVTGRPLFEPRPLMTLAVALALFAAAALVAGRVGLLPRPAAVAPAADLAVWVLAGGFALRAIGDFRYVGFFKRIRGTAFSRLDTAVYSPLCALLALLIGAIALS